MTKKTETYSRQLKYLLVLGDEIIKEDGIFREGLFFFPNSGNSQTFIRK